MTIHETAALRYWRELNSTLSFIGADPVTFDIGQRWWASGVDLDDAAQRIVVSREPIDERPEPVSRFRRSLGWGPYGNAPSKAESWGRR